MFYNARLFMACHSFSYSITFRHGFGFLNYVKDLFSALRFTFCIYCYVYVLSHVTGFPFMLLYYIYHMYPIYQSNIRFGVFFYSNYNFVSMNYVLEYLLSHPYDLLCMFLWLQEFFLFELEKTGTSSSHQQHRS